MARISKKVAQKVETQAETKDWVAKDDLIEVPLQEDEEFFVPEFPEEKQEPKDELIEVQLQEDEELFVPEFPEEKQEEHDLLTENDDWIDSRDDSKDYYEGQVEQLSVVEIMKPDPEHLRALKDDLEADYLEKTGFKRAKEGVPGAKVVCNINGHNVSNECKIKMSPNPKRVGSKAHERYAEYEHAGTVGEYLEAGGLKADLRFDHNKGYLELKEHVVGGQMVAIVPKVKK